MLGILLRGWYLFHIPHFSEDYFRFLWDGNLLLHGIHPYALLPSEMLQMPMYADWLPTDWVSKMNSPNYYSVYPPVCQFIFASAVKWGGGSVAEGVWIMKSFLFCCEIGTLLLLLKLGKNHHPALLYALHPLPIFEIMGNCHFEGAMIFFLLASIYCLKNKAVLAASIWLALSVATKLLPLIFLPAVFFFLDKKLIIKFFGGFTMGLLVLFLPLWDTTTLLHLAKSLNLYFQKFEFNASMYYLARGLGYMFQEYNLGSQIAPILAVLTATAAVVLPFLKVKKDNFDSLLWSMATVISIYFFNSSTVHPWYLIMPLVLGSLMAWQFTVVWAVVVFFSYSHYVGGGFEEQFGWIWAEYLLVFGCLFCWDLRRNPNISLFK